MPKALIFERFASRRLNSEPAGWNMPVSRTGSPVSTPNGTMSSISKSTSSPIWTRVAEAFLGQLDRHPLDAEVLADERAHGLHRATLRPGEHAAELLHLLVGRRLVDDHARRQLPSVITLGVSAMTATTAVR